MSTTPTIPIDIEFSKQSSDKALKELTSYFKEKPVKLSIKVDKVAINKQLNSFKLPKLVLKPTVATDTVQKSLDNLKAPKLKVGITTDVKQVQNDLKALKSPNLDVNLTADTKQVQAQLNSLKTPSLDIEVSADTKQIQGKLNSLSPPSLNIDIATDTKSIQSQLNAIKTPKIDLGLTVDTKSIQSQLNSLKTPKLAVGLSVDTNKLQSEINSISPPEIDVNLGSNIEVLQSEIKGLEAPDLAVNLSSNIDKLQSEIKNIDTQDIKINVQSNAKQVIRELNKAKDISVKLNIDNSKAISSIKEIESQSKQSADNSSGFFSSAFSGGFLGGLAGGGAVAGIQAVIGGLSALGEASADVRKLQNQISAFTGASGKELDDFTVKISAISETFEQDSEELAISAQALAKGFDISFGEASDVMQELLISGANATGELIPSLKEFSSIAKQSGISLAEMKGILSTGATEGLFADKLIDGVKELGLRLGELPQSTRDALKPLGEEFNNQLFKDIESGAITTTEAFLQIGEQINNTSLSASELATITADVTGSQGEDIGGVVKFYELMKKSVEDVNKPLTEQELALKRQVEAQEKLESVTVPALRIMGEAFNKIKIFAGELVGEIIDIAKAVKSGLDLGDAGEKMKAVFSNISEALKPVYKVIKNVIIDGLGLVFSTVKKIFDSLMDILSPLFDVFGEIKKELSEMFGEVQSGAGVFDFLADVVSNMLNIITPILKFAVVVVGEFVKILFKTGKTIGEYLAPIVIGLGKIIGDLIGGIADAVQWFGKLVGLVDETAESTEIATEKTEELQVAQEKQVLSNEELSKSFVDTNGALLLAKNKYKELAKELEKGGLTANEKKKLENYNKELENYGKFIAVLRNEAKLDGVIDASEQAEIDKMTASITKFSATIKGTNEVVKKIVKKQIKLSKESIDLVASLKFTEYKNELISFKNTLDSVKSEARIDGIIDTKETEHINALNEKIFELQGTINLVNKKGLSVLAGETLKPQTFVQTIEFKAKPVSEGLQADLLAENEKNQQKILDENEKNNAKIQIVQGVQAKSKLQNLIDSNLAELDELRNQKQRILDLEIESNNDYINAQGEFISEKQYRLDEANQIRLESQQADDEAEAERKSEQRINEAYAISEQTGTLIEINEVYKDSKLSADEKVNKSAQLGMKLFAEHTIAYKALAITKAIMDTYQGATKVLTDLPVPANFIASGLIIATGLQNIAKIGGANDGMSSVSEQAVRQSKPSGQDRHLVMLADRERVLTADTNMKFYDVLESMENGTYEAIYQTPKIQVKNDYKLPKIEVQNTVSERSYNEVVNELRAVKRAIRNLQLETEINTYPRFEPKIIVESQDNRGY